MSSSDYVNYALRPNKAVERKLIFEVLSSIAPLYSFEGYRYIGLGSMWFVDFVMAHKILSISDMISIEKDEYAAARQEFNKPFACVKVEPGESNIVLREIDLSAKRSLVWMDYDSTFSESVLRDLEVLCERVPSRSIVIATINAQKNSLPQRDKDGKELGDELARLRFVGKDLIPASLPPSAMQTSQYPITLSAILFDHMRRAIRKAGREHDQLLPLFNIRHQDGAVMLTVGGVIVDEARAVATRALVAAKGFGALLNEGKQQEIDVPPLTFREKGSLDQLMPRAVKPTEAEVEALRFRLKPSQIESYHRYYRYYPTFGEVST